MMIRSVWGIVLALGGMALAGCREKASAECTLAEVRDGAPRKEITQDLLILERGSAGWKPQRLLKVRKWEDRARHLDLSGTLEVLTAKGAPGTKIPADGPAFLDAEVTRALGGISDGDFARVSAERSRLLDGAEVAIPVPEGTLQPGAVLRWLPAGGWEPGALAEQPFARELTRPWEAQLRALPVEDLAPSRNALARLPYRTPEGLEAEFPVEAVHWSGNPRNRLNLVILADGYRAEELPLFRQHVAEMTRVLLEEHSPYREFRDLINVIRVDTPSEESGADCEDRKYSPRKNRYGTAFTVACLNSVLKTSFNDRFLYQFKAARVRRESSQVYFDGVSVADEVFVLVNSPKYGGTTVFWATQTRASSWATAAHEMGHSWGRLADEYLVEGDLCHLYMATAANVSLKKTSARGLKWKEWLLPGTPLPTPDEEAFDGVVGLFQGAAGGCKKIAYRPVRNCKMRSHDADFCPVCKEKMIHRIYDRAGLIDGPLTAEGNEVTAPVLLAERLRTRWYVDGELVQETSGYRPLRTESIGGKEVRLVVQDEQAPVRRDRCSLVFSAVSRF